MRLNIDLQEVAGLPIGVRSGSATQKAMASGRKPTLLDQTALWFSEEDDEETAQSYCDKAGSDSVVLRANLANYAVTPSGYTVYIQVPCNWVDIDYESVNGTYLPIFQFQGRKFESQLAKIRGTVDESSSDEDDSF